MIRKDRLENRSDAPVEINLLCSRFVLDSNDYEVYTQYNAWQHESRGGWQPLRTQVTAASGGIRTCDGAAPILALHNRHSGQNTVFHLLPNAGWQMTARKFSYSKREIIVVKTGLQSDHLHLRAAAGETVELGIEAFMIDAGWFGRGDEW